MTNDRTTRSGDERAQFLTEVFPAELEEIRRRRRNAGDARELPTPADDPRPDVSHDLTGLALSGGGIRSAAFSLGVLQQLIDSGGLKKFDYLSTVSGGGFVGSSVSSLMHNDQANSVSGARLLLDGTEGGEAAALNHIRNGSNYLVPPGLLNQLRVPALLLVGVLQMLLLAFPIVVFCVLITEVMFDVTGRYDLLGIRKWVPLLAAAPLLVGIFWRPYSRTGLHKRLRRMVVGKAAGRNYDWTKRDGQDRRLGGYLLLALLGAAGVPLVILIEHPVSSDGASLGAAVVEGLRAQIGLHFKGWLLWGGLAMAGVLGLTYAHWRPRVLTLLLSISGPLILVLMYVFLCVGAINSPTVRAGEYPRVSHALAAGEPTHWQAIEKEVAWLRTASNATPFPAPTPGDVAAEAAPTSAREKSRSRFIRLLRSKGIQPEDYVLDRCREGIAFWVLDPRVERPAELKRRLSTHSRGTITAQLHLSRSGQPYIYVPELSILEGNAEWWLYLLALIVFLYHFFFVDVNLLSHNQFYRDRLSRTFVISPKESDGKAVQHDDVVKLSDLSGEESTAPYHLLNTALNLQGSHDAGVRDRHTVSMLLSKRYSGSEKTGYCRTEDLELEDPEFDLATAMAISAAAAAPNMGAMQVRSMTLALTLLNIRIGYWLPNPRLVRKRGQVRRERESTRSAKRVITRVHDAVRRGHKAGALEVFREATGKLHDKGEFVNCTDGGHIENLGVYGLLQRRCRTILCVDAEADPDLRFAGLTTLERYANIDLNTQVSVQVDAVRKGQTKPTADGDDYGYPLAIGSITYPDGSTGTLIYIKLGMIPDAPEYLRFYSDHSPRFPHESTSSQFFGETQFEVYRRLGSELARIALQQSEIRAAIGLVDE